MTSVTELFEISSQQKFIDFSMAVLEGKLDFPANVKFKNWPKIELNIKGKRYHSSLPTSVMEGFVQFQNDVYLAFALIKYGVADLRKLSATEKQDLELIFEIKEGSTDSNSTIDDWANKALGSLGNIMSGMNSRDKAAVLITLVLGAGGYFAFDSYQSNQTEQVKVQKDVELARLKVESEKVTAETQKQSIAALQDANQQIQKVTVAALQQKITEEASEETLTRIKTASAQFNAGHRAVVRSAQDAEQITIASAVLDKEAIKEIAKKPRPVRDRQPLTVECIMQGMKRHKDFMTFNVSCPAGEFPLRVATNIEGAKSEVDVLFEALRTGRPVKIKLNANYIDQKIEKAQFVGVIKEPVAKV
ncbi:hypothetical protein K0I73_04120 [Shewanella mesophila]|uniref:hypothetical protein n=1 Tax=Shewanella mesophila TaxID=2864208 RepID=UPI001C661563|nr:hypothetical protein [Shewanella mesophila]QYJ86931.1 hypothetical protein K0I73_04120 [Shewanella mesophila]